MSYASLAARYRPQTFAEVTGQETVKAILSRSAAEDRVAPAYLLSGTRGVGKTTIARIFAKALNCEHAPTGEPCNQCEQCRRITQGNHVDVVEIDGASNRGIDDARRLREAIAYAPMEGRYKVFIIDEAHMLTRESFNALLKTLEEPPARSTFILATTEVHKFPITIVSRCQHLIFKAIPEAELAAHLIRVLTREGIPFEENAVRLLARRASGSVRDSMSLLGQTLALGGDRLTEAATRSVLGLAGQELYERLLHALHEQDCVAVAEITRELLERGVDLGFFLRELSTLWRNLFLVRQAGPAALSVLDMPDAEKQRLQELAPQFEVAYIHAAWQMVLESQRQVLGSIDPSSALELLLLNLALLPRLVSLEQLSSAVSVPPSQKSGMANAKETPVTRFPHPTANGVPGSRPVAPVNTVRDSVRAGARSSSSDDAAGQSDSPPWDPAPAETVPQKSEDTGSVSSLSEVRERKVPAEKPVEASSSSALRAEKSVASSLHADTSAATVKESVPVEPEVSKSRIAVPGAQNEAANTGAVWQRFLDYCSTSGCSAGFPLQAVKTATGIFSGESLRLATMSSFQYEQLVVPAHHAELERLASGFIGCGVQASVLPPTNPRKTEADLKKEFASHPLIVSLAETFDATLVRCIPLEQSGIPDLSLNDSKASKEKRNAEHE